MEGHTINVSRYRNGSLLLRETCSCKPSDHKKTEEQTSALGLHKHLHRISVFWPGCAHAAFAGGTGSGSKRSARWGQVFCSGRDVLSSKEKPVVISCSRSAEKCIWISAGSGRAPFAVKSPFRSTGSPASWLQHYTRTKDSHWQEAGAVTPHRPFPDKPYFCHLLDEIRRNKVLFIEKSRDMMLFELLLSPNTLQPDTPKNPVHPAEPRSPRTRNFDFPILRENVIRPLPPKISSMSCAIE